MAKKRSIELNDLFRIKAVNRVAMSPDGRWIAFEMKRFDLQENRNFTQLMLVDIESGKTRALTSGKHNDTMPRWSPDGHQLAFLSDRDKGSCLFTLAMAGGEPVRWTVPDGFVSDAAWSPDGKRIAYTWQPMSEREKLERDDKRDQLKKLPQFKHITRLFHKLDGAGWWNGEYTHVWVADLTSQKRRQVTTGAYDDREPRWSPDGRLISFVSNRVKEPDMFSDNADVYVVKPGGGAIKKITQMPGACSGHSWSPDGRWIAFIGYHAGPGQGWKFNETVWVVPSTGGKPRDLTRSLDHHCRNLTIGDVTGSGFEVAAPIWSADAGELYFLVSESGNARVYRCSAKGKDIRRVHDDEGNVLHMNRTGLTGPIAISFGTATNPGDIGMIDPHNGAQIQTLTSVNADSLGRVQVQPPYSFNVKSGAHDIHTWVLKPPGFDPRKKYPAILEIHGGPHAQYGQSFFHEMQWMAARGYVVVYCNPRGSIGYGIDFCKCIHADWGNLDYKDIAKVTDWLFAQRYIDRKRVGVTGGSYGGYMTNWIVGHTDRFAAAVTQRSVVNLESMFGTSDFGYDMGHEFGGLPWAALKEYRRQSPLSYVRNIRTPLLIEHEEQDHRCPIEQGEQLFTSLKTLGRTVEMVRFEGEFHGLSRGGRPQNRAERLRRIMAWFDKYLK